MPTLLKKLIKSLPAFGVGVLAWMTQVSPDDASSNLAKWYGKIASPPSWLIPQNRDTWATAVLSLLCIALLTVIWRKDKYVPLPRAAEIAYEKGRQANSVWAYEADRHRKERGGGPEKALDFMAGVIAGMVPLYGKHAPSKAIEEVGNIFKKRPMVFEGGAKSGHFVSGTDGAYTDIGVRRQDLKVVIKNIENGLKTTTKI